LYIWIEFLRQNRSGVTDRIGDRMDSKRQEDSKRQDGQQETGRTPRDRADSKRQDRQQGTGQGLKVRLSKMGEQDCIIYCIVWPDRVP
jgi:hypothetical protein